MDNLIVIGNLTNYHNAIRLIAASNGITQASFAYDAKNRCVKRVMNGMTNYLYYDNWNLVEERDNNGNLLASYVHGEKIDEILTRFTPTQTVYYHHDALGNVSHLTDDVGNLLEHYVYDAFGAPIILNATNGIITTSSYGNRFLFTGREYLPEMGLYDYRNRVYSTEFGRFLQTDPIRFGLKKNRKVTWFINGIQSGYNKRKYIEDVNIYRYVVNNPINLVDFDGLTAPNPPTHEGLGIDVILGGFIGLCKAIQFYGTGGNKNDPNRDKEFHCESSCAIASTAGDEIAESCGNAKEKWIDHQNPDNPNPDSQADQEANAAGRDCANDPRGCECCCREKGF